MATHCVEPGDLFLGRRDGGEKKVMSMSGLRWEWHIVRETERPARWHTRNVPRFLTRRGATGAAAEAPSFATVASPSSAAAAAAAVETISSICLLLRRVIGLVSGRVA